MESLTGGEVSIMMTARLVNFIIGVNKNSQEICKI